MNNSKKEDKLTWIVAIIGIIIFIILVYATIILWDQAHPIPKSPEGATRFAEPGLPQQGYPWDQSPGIQIDPVGNWYRGDQVTVSGTTSDPARNAIRVVIVAQDAAQQRTWAGNTIAALPESGSINTWSFVFDSTSFNTSGNVVTACIEGITPSVCTSQRFNLQETVLPAATPAGCWQRIDPVADHAAGEVFVISGRTNCKAGDRITVEIVSVSSGRSSRDYINGSVEIRQISENSQGWSVTIDSSSLSPGQKTVSACGVGICGFWTFNITE
ncbi:MAG: hypothetical protein M0Q91_16225 [Methanoregula sp.]|jgi:hypothetical protein|nr:hypothetical protein [Methanoregula sp.]